MLPSGRLCKYSSNDWIPSASGYPKISCSSQVLLGIMRVFALLPVTLLARGLALLDGFLLFDFDDGVLCVPEGRAVLGFVIAL